MASQEDTEKLAKALLQWNLVQKLLHRLKEATSGFTPVEHRNSAVKMENSLGRWLATLQLYGLSRDELDDQDYPLFPRTPLRDGTSKTEFTGMLEKRFDDMSIDQASEIVDHLHDQIYEFFDREVSFSGEIELRCEPGRKNPELYCITVGQFWTPVSPRIRYLVDNFGVIKTALLCLRYDPLNLFKGGESSLSVTTMNVLYDVGEARYEGFASPINCQLLGRPDVKFCSLFQDTDSAFGSLGNFFRINLADHPGGWVLNPPFLEAVINKTARKVVKALEETEPESLWFFVTFPRWIDNKGWLLLDKSVWKIDRIDMKESTFENQDCYGRLSEPRYEICMFVLGSLPQTVNLKNLRRKVRLVCKAKQMVSNRTGRRQSCV